MIRRRDLVFAGLGVGALGAAEALRPRHRLILLRNATMAKTIPMGFGQWQAEEANLVGPEQAGRLAKALYSETVERNYYEANSGGTVMMLIAYGDTQSDLLQLHRPESCYPAVGFTLESTRAYNLALAPGAVLPTRRVVATTAERRENIVYWTRMGEKLPQSAGQQREARLDNAIHGFVPDGVLARCSVLGDSDAAFALLDRFVPQMLAAVAPAGRPALIGTRLAKMVTA